MSRGMKIGLILGVLALVGGGVVAFQHQQEEERRHRGPHGAGRPARPGQRRHGQRQDRAARPRWTSAPTSPAASSRSRCDEGDLVSKGQFLIQIDPAQYQAAVSPGARASWPRPRPRCSRPRPTATRPSGQLEPRAASCSQLGPEPDRARSGRAGADRRYDVAEATYQATRAQLEPGPRRPAGGPGQPGQDPAHLPDRRPGHPAGGGGGRGRGARHLLAGDRPAHDDRRPVRHPGQGAGGRDRRGAARAGDSVRGDHRRLPGHHLRRPGDQGQQQRQADRHPDRVRVQRPRGGLRRRDHARRPAGGHPARPELHRPHRHRHPRATRSASRSSRSPCATTSGCPTRTIAAAPTRSAGGAPGKQEDGGRVRGAGRRSRPSARSRSASRATSTSRCSTGCARARPSWPAPTRRSAT